MSVGLEDEADLLEDFGQALEAARRATAAREALEAARHATPDGEIAAGA